jgi:lipopolysaccharide transport system ATP-binding protein
MIAIRCEGISKQYRLGEQERYRALRDVLTNAASAPFRRLHANLRNGNGSSIGNRQSGIGNHIWALQDVSFEINAGEVVGIIGRNGAGKSTLLKLLSRITKPTRGCAEINGRVGSLLEVGTGFHPELTGRENIFLNGAILGMRKAEIERKFDEIVSFAEVERFVDTPVKRYSSGMYVRLAFAVAAHMETEILVVDEVLAVGDAEFQKKCLGKMGDVAKDGRTVLFVSHNMSAIRTLCERTLLLNKGKLVFSGNSFEGIALYRSESSRDGGDGWQRNDGDSTPQIFFESISTKLVSGKENLSLHCDIEIRCNQKCAPAFLAVDISDQSAITLMQALPTVERFISGEPGEHQVALDIELPPLVPGNYAVSFWIGSHFTKTADFVKDAASFEITTSPTQGRAYPHTLDHGSIVPNSTYSYKFSPGSES